METKLFTCPHCKSSFQERRLFDLHLFGKDNCQKKNKFSPPGKSRYTCKRCDQSFEFKAELIVHQHLLIDQCHRKRTHRVRSQNASASASPKEDLAVDDSSPHVSQLEVGLNSILDRSSEVSPPKDYFSRPPDFSSDSPKFNLTLKDGKILPQPLFASGPVPSSTTEECTSVRSCCLENVVDQELSDPAQVTIKAQTDGDLTNTVELSRTSSTAGVCNLMEDVKVDHELNDADMKAADGIRGEEDHDSIYTAELSSTSSATIEYTAVETWQEEDEVDDELCDTDKKAADGIRGSEDHDLDLTDTVVLPRTSLAAKVCSWLEDGKPDQELFVTDMKAADDIRGGEDHDLDSIYTAELSSTSSATLEYTEEQSLLEDDKIDSSQVSLKAAGADGITQPRDTLTLIDSAESPMTKSKKVICKVVPKISTSGLQISDGFDLYDNAELIRPELHSKSEGKFASLGGSVTATSEEDNKRLSETNQDIEEGRMTNDKGVDDDGSRQMGRAELADDAVKNSRSDTTFDSQTEWQEGDHGRTPFNTNAHIVDDQPPKHRTASDDVVGRDANTQVPNTATHSCLVCAFKTARQRDLVEHVRSKHRGTTSLVSTLFTFRCGEKERKMNLKRGAEDRLFKCPYCPKTSNKRQHMQYHIRTHTDERPFQCKVCGCKSNQQTTIVQHLWTIHEAAVIAACMNKEVDESAAVRRTESNMDATCNQDRKVTEDVNFKSTKESTADDDDKHGSIITEEEINDGDANWSNDDAKEVDMAHEGSRQETSIEIAGEEVTNGGRDETVDSQRKEQKGDNGSTGSLSNTTVDTGDDDQQPSFKAASDDEVQDAGYTRLETEDSSSQEMHCCRVRAFKSVKSSDVITHVRSRHKGATSSVSDLYTFQCGEKEQKLNLKQDAKSRLYKCPYCTKTSKLRPNMKFHIRTHTGEQPYWCKMCDCKKKWQSTMVSHIWTVHEAAAIKSCMGKDVDDITPVQSTEPDRDATFTQERHVTEDPNPKSTEDSVHGESFDVKINNDADPNETKDAAEEMMNTSDNGVDDDGGRRKASVEDALMNIEWNEWITSRWKEQEHYNGRTMTPPNTKANVDDDQLPAREVVSYDEVDGTANSRLEAEGTNQALNEDLHRCLVCKFKSTKAVLVEHVRRKHKKTTSGTSVSKLFTFRCGVMERTIKLHRDAKSRLFKCPYCPKTSNVRHSMVYHIRIHTGECPYQCNVCGCKKKNHTAIVAHIWNSHEASAIDASMTKASDEATPVPELIEEPITPISCLVCHFQSDKPADIVKHIQSRHKGTTSLVWKLYTFQCGEKEQKMNLKRDAESQLFKCPSCSYKVNKEYMMKRHVRIHTGECPYQCKMCGCKKKYLSSVGQHIWKAHEAAALKSCMKINVVDETVALQGTESNMDGIMSSPDRNASAEANPKSTKDPTTTGDNDRLHSLTALEEVNDDPIDTTINDAAQMIANDNGVHNNGGRLNTSTEQEGDASMNGERNGCDASRWKDQERDIGRMAPPDSATANGELLTSDRIEPNEDSDDDRATGVFDVQSLSEGNNGSSISTSNCQGFEGLHLPTKKTSVVKSHHDEHSDVEASRRDGCSSSTLSGAHQFEGIFSKMGDYFQHLHPSLTEESDDEDDPVKEDMDEKVKKAQKHECEQEMPDQHLHPSGDVLPSKGSATANGELLTSDRIEPNEDSDDDRATGVFDVQSLSEGNNDRCNSTEDEEMIGEGVNRQKNEQQMVDQHLHPGVTDEESGDVIFSGKVDDDEEDVEMNEEGTKRQAIEQQMLDQYLHPGVTNEESGDVMLSRKGDDDDERCHSKEDVEMTGEDAQKQETEQEALNPQLLRTNHSVQTSKDMVRRGGSEDDGLMKNDTTGCLLREGRGETVVGGAETEAVTGTVTRLALEARSKNAKVMKCNQSEKKKVHDVYAFTDIENNGSDSDVDTEVNKVNKENNEEKSKRSSKMQAETSWVQCDMCSKWRKLPCHARIDEVNGEDEWFCKMNPDTSRNDCEIPEEAYMHEEDETVVYSDNGNKVADHVRLKNGRAKTFHRKLARRTNNTKRKAINMVPNTQSSEREEEMDGDTLCVSTTKARKRRTSNTKQKATNLVLNTQSSEREEEIDGDTFCVSTTKARKLQAQGLAWCLDCGGLTVAGKCSGDCAKVRKKRILTYDTADDHSGDIDAKKRKTCSDAEGRTCSGDFNGVKKRRTSSDTEQRANCSRDVIGVKNGTTPNVDIVNDGTEQTRGSETADVMERKQNKGKKRRGTHIADVPTDGDKWYRNKRRRKSVFDASGDKVIRINHDYIIQYSEADVELAQKLKSTRSKQCPYCSKRFSCYNAVIMHSRMHTGAHPFVCLHCRQRCMHRQHTFIHIVTQHWEKSKEAFEKMVKWCGKQKPGEKLKKCKECEWSHEHTQLGDRLFCCTVCLSHFSSVSAAQQHIIVNHRKKLKRRVAKLQGVKKSRRSKTTLEGKLEERELENVPSKDVGTFEGENIGSTTHTNDVTSAMVNELDPLGVKPSASHVTSDMVHELDPLGIRPSASHETTNEKEGTSGMFEEKDNDRESSGAITSDDVSKLKIEAEVHQLDPVDAASSASPQTSGEIDGENIASSTDTDDVTSDMVHELGPLGVRPSTSHEIINEQEGTSGMFEEEHNDEESSGAITSDNVSASVLGARTSTSHPTSDVEKGMLDKLDKEKNDAVSCGKIEASENFDGAHHANMASDPSVDGAMSDTISDQCAKGVRFLSLQTSDALKETGERLEEIDGFGVTLSSSSEVKDILDPADNEILTSDTGTDLEKMVAAKGLVCDLDASDVPPLSHTASDDIDGGLMDFKSGDCDLDITDVRPVVKHEPSDEMEMESMTAKVDEEVVLDGDLLCSSNEALRNIDTHETADIATNVAIAEMSSNSEGDFDARGLTSHEMSDVPNDSVLEELQGAIGSEGIADVITIPEMSGGHEPSVVNQDLGVNQDTLLISQEMSDANERNQQNLVAEKVDDENDDDDAFHRDFTSGTDGVGINLEMCENADSIHGVDLDVKDIMPLTGQERKSQETEEQFDDQYDDGDNDDSCKGNADDTDNEVNKGNASKKVKEEQNSTAELPNMSNQVSTSNSNLNQSDQEGPQPQQDGEGRLIDPAYSANLSSVQNSAAMNEIARQGAPPVIEPSLTDRLRLRKSEERDPVNQPADATHLLGISESRRTDLIPMATTTMDSMSSINPNYRDYNQNTWMNPRPQASKKRLVDFVYAPSAGEKLLWEEEEVQCPVCSIEETSTKDLMSHMRERHSGETPFRCVKCVFASMNIQTMVDHVNGLHAASVFDLCHIFHICQWRANSNSAKPCNPVASGKRACRPLNSDDEFYHCSSCGFKSFQLPLMVDHAQRVHKKCSYLEVDPSSQEVVCPVCLHHWDNVMNALSHTCSPTRRNMTFPYGEHVNESQEQRADRRDADVGSIRFWDPAFQASHSSHVSSGQEKYQSAVLNPAKNGSTIPYFPSHSNHASSRQQAIQGTQSFRRHSSSVNLPSTSPDFNDNPSPIENQERVSPGYASVSNPTRHPRKQRRSTSGQQPSEDSQSVRQHPPSVYPPSTSPDFHENPSPTENQDRVSPVYASVTNPIRRLRKQRRSSSEQQASEGSLSGSVRQHPSVYLPFTSPDFHDNPYQIENQDRVSPGYRSVSNPTRHPREWQGSGELQDHMTDDSNHLFGENLYSSSAVAAPNWLPRKRWGSGFSQDSMTDDSSEHSVESHRSSGYSSETTLTRYHSSASVTNPTRHPRQRWRRSSGQQWSQGSQSFRQHPSVTQLNHSLKEEQRNPHEGYPSRPDLNPYTSRSSNHPLPMQSWQLMVGRERHSGSLGHAPDIPSCRPKQERRSPDVTHHAPRLCQTEADNATYNTLLWNHTATQEQYDVHRRATEQSIGQRLGQRQSVLGNLQEKSDETPTKSEVLPVIVNVRSLNTSESWRKS